MNGKINENIACTVQQCKYQVQIIRNYKSVYIETFDTIQEAIIARDTFINNYNTLNNRIVWILVSQ